jgi:lipoate-protein ligase A
VVDNKENNLDNNEYNIDKADKLRIFYSEEYNPWYNLALEEYLLEQVNNDEIILYLWQNEHTVVIGRNQNAWKECRCSKLEDEDGGFLARRLSGGGAVYHDLGNLNFTFLMERENYDLHQQLSVILDAVKELGIEAEFSGRNDLTAQDKKFSGNAFYFGTDKAYHHGTILYDTEIEPLLEYLAVSKEKIESKGIESVRSRVINLKDINPELNLDSIKKELELSFVKIYGNGNTAKDIIKVRPSQMKELAELYKKYSSWDWRYGMTPDFDIYFENRFDWGGLELGLNLKDGIINEAGVYSDAMQAELFAKMAPLLENTKFDKNKINAQINKLKNEKNEEIITDITEWIEARDI